MSIANFFTLQTLTPGQTSAAGHQALGGPVLNGLNFLDVILAQLGQGTSEETKPATDGALQSDNPALDKKPTLDLAELLAATPEVSEEVKALALNNEEEIAQTLALNQKAFDEMLKPLLNADGTITINGKAVKIGTDKDAEAIVNLFVINAETDDRSTLMKLKSILSRIEDRIGKDKPALIVTNLTPEQITELKQRIEKILSGEDTSNEALDEILIGFVQMVPPQQHQNQPSFNADMASLDAKLPVASENGKFSESKPNNLLSSDAKDASSAKPDLSTLKGWKFSPEGSVLTLPPSFDEMMQSWGYGQHAPSVTGLQNAANPIMQSSGAPQPVPAMQAVVATITKAAAEGENKNIRLQLEPPELGRIEVRMSFGKDKTVKAVLMAEKPETLAMLQRDSFHLERALQNAGLEASGSSLSFELADSGYDFNQNGGHDGHGGSGGGNASGEEGEIIQSTMTWHVDPETGHMRYNLMV